jgi:exodeoxyribonuclease-1
LYGGFIGNNDRRTLNDLRAMNAQQLTAAHPHFQDPRLEELLFRYRARNFPHSLSADEQQKWEQHRAARLLDGATKALTVEQFFDRIDTLQESASETDEEILGALYDYAEQITPVR